MAPFKVPQGPYTIDKVMESIREQVIEPRAQVGPDDAQPDIQPAVDNGSPSSRLTSHLDRMRQRQKLDPGYRIRSHRPIVGWVINLFKRMIHWGSHPYTDAVRERQETFNEAALAAYREMAGQQNATTGKLKETSARQNIIAGQIQQTAQTLDDLQHYRDSQQQALERLEKHLVAVQTTLGDFRKMLDERSQAAQTQITSLREVAERSEGNLTELAHRHEQLKSMHHEIERMHRELDDRLRSSTGQLAGRIDTLYSRHDLVSVLRTLPDEARGAELDAMRGPVEEIQMRQSQYVKLFKNLPGQILDIGCGRGELLAMLRIEGIESWGAEIDPLMVSLCRDRDIHVVEGDGLNVLRQVAPASLGGIFCAQVVEHLFPGELLGMLRLARERIADGGRIVIETLNPASLGVIAKSYYCDLDHKQPIHPEYMKSLLEMAGFDQVELHFLAPFDESERLPDLPPAKQLGIATEARDALQARIDRLNQCLFGMQDYYVIGQQGDPLPPVRESATEGDL